MKCEGFEQLAKRMHSLIKLDSLSFYVNTKAVLLSATALTPHRIQEALRKSMVLVSLPWPDPHLPVHHDSTQIYVSHGLPQPSAILRERTTTTALRETGTEILE